MSKSGSLFVLFALFSLILLCSPREAMALSAGGTALNGWDRNTSSLNKDLAFNEGEVITIIVSSTGPTLWVNCIWDIPWVVPGGWENKTVTPGNSGVFIINIPTTGTYRLMVFDDLHSIMHVKITVVVPPPPDDSDTVAAVSSTVASASRGQTSVVVGNIMSRAVTVPFAGMASREQESGPVSADSFGSLFQKGGPQEAREISIKEFAHFANFNTSQVLAAVTDPGVSGIEQRRGIVSSDPFTIWGHASFTSADNDFNINGDDRRYNGDVWGYSLGADYRLHEDFIAGASVGYADADMTTTFESGKYKEKSWSVSPYLITNPLMAL